MTKFTKLKPEWKAEWLELLRSGEYEQGMGTLCSPRPEADQFCCLGVMADDLVQRGHGTWEESIRNPEWLNFKVSGVGGYSGALPLPARDLIGLDDAAATRLISMNDYGTSFAEIADWIEANL